MSNLYNTREKTGERTICLILESEYLEPFLLYADILIWLFFIYNENYVANM